MATHYKQENGQFHLHDDLVKHGPDGAPVVDAQGEHVREEKLVHSSAEIGVAYCQLPERLHIFTHGTVEGMKAWVDAHNAHSPHKAVLKVFDQSTPEETLNNAILDPSFLAGLV